MKLVILAIAILCGVVWGEKTRYDGYKLLNVFPESQEQADLIAQFELNEDFDLWSRIRGLEGVKVSLSPDAFLKYSELFKLFKIKYTILDHNLQDRFDEEERKMSISKRESSGRIAGRYVSHAEINNFINDVTDNHGNHPTLNVEMHSAGRTFENRDMRIIVIGTKRSSNANGKNKVFIDCGIHAREWVSPCTCNWFIDQIIAGYERDEATNVYLLENLEFHILPVLNPDGYEFSRTNTRLHRKNRAPNAGSTCNGTDLNRNFPAQWGTGGSSSLACSDTYMGSRPGSELETQAVINYLEKFRGRWLTYLTVHSYGKWWFTPYGYTTRLPDDFQALNASAGIGINAIMNTYKQTGWTSGSSSVMLYVASGGSEDTAYINFGIKWSYCLELRPGQSNDPDSGFGFQLPEDRCPLAGEETYQGIKAYLRDIMSKEGFPAMQGKK